MLTANRVFVLTLFGKDYLFEIKEGSGKRIPLHSIIRN